MSEGVAFLEHLQNSPTEGEILEAALLLQMSGQMLA